MRRIQSLVARAARHDGDVADVLAQLRDGYAGEKELNLLTHLGGREADEIQSILIRDESHDGRAITPIAVGLPHVGDVPHNAERLLGDAIQLRGIGADDPELDRKRRGWAKDELGHVHESLGHEPIGHRGAKPMLQRFAGVGVRGQHDDLGERGIRQFRCHREEEAGSTLTDIARDDLALGLTAQPTLELLHRGSRRFDTGSFG